MPDCPPVRDEDGPPATRRLAAIAFVDVVGYSSMVESNETGTVRRWMNVLDSLIRPRTGEHRGRIVKSTGDGILAEFPSALDAVAWARDVQRSVTTASAAHDDASLPVTLRISLHLGEVIAIEDDVFGDGVNVAARLQEYAPPGGIVLSQTLYDLVRGSLGVEGRDLGFLELRNFEKPFRAYALDPETPGIVTPRRPARAPLPSIAILPLQNVGDDAADDYFSEGVVEDITVSLAGLREVMVIARASTLAFRGRQADPREVGQLLGVRYVLVGTLRRAEQRVRLSVELCDANAGTRLWGERAEVAPGELFAVQDRIVERIVAGIAPNVRVAEMRAAMRKRPESFSAYDHTLRGIHIINSLDRNTFPQALECLNAAMREDPNFAMAFAWAARWHSLHVGQGWSKDRLVDASKAVELAAKAIELDRDNALALATYGHLKSYLFHEWDTARVYLDRALAACPNHSLAWILSSATLSYVGRSEEAIKHAENALRLSPFDQSLFYYYQLLNTAHYVHGNYEEAVKWGRMSTSENPTYTANYRFLAAALTALGRREEAQEAASQLLRLEPDFRLSVYERTRQPFRDAHIKARFMRHLRASGLPE